MLTALAAKYLLRIEAQFPKAIFIGELTVFWAHTNFMWENMFFFQSTVNASSEQQGTLSDVLVGFAEIRKLMT